MAEDRQYLADMLQAADDVALVVVGVSEEGFMKDRIR